MNSHCKVFISYAHDDRGFARDIYRIVRESGGLPWLDEFDLLPGQDWQLEIEKAIESAYYFLALLSSQSVNKRGYVQKELKLGLEILERVPEGDIYILYRRYA